MKPTPKLDFEQTRGGDYVANIGRYRVRLEKDSTGDSPWDSWDGNAPYMQAGARFGDSVRTKGNFPEVRDLVKGLTRQTLRPFLACLAAACKAERHTGRDDCESPLDLYREARLMAGTSDPETVARYAFDMALDCFYSRNPLALYAAAFKARGWPCLEHTSTGYSQGDYAELLFVWTPEAAAKCGIPLDLQTGDLEKAGHLFDCWAWGDVYGYVIETREGDTVDSCWGYYTQSPDDDEESGMLDAIRDALPDDWHVDAAIGAAALYAVA